MPSFSNLAVLAVAVRSTYAGVALGVDLGPKLGLAPKADGQDQSQSQQLDPNRSAAVAMAGLAGHNVDEMALLQNHGQSWAAGTAASSSPDHMANDLTSLFEAAGGLQALGHGSLAHGEGSGVFDPVHHSSEGLENGSALFGGDEGLSNILKDLF